MLQYGGSSAGLLLETFQQLQDILQRGVEYLLHDFVRDPVAAAEGPVAVDFPRRSGIHQAGGNYRGGLIVFQQFADDGKRKGLQPVCVSGLDFMPGSPRGRLAENKSSPGK